MKSLLALLAVALLGLSTVACGAASKDTGSSVSRTSSDNGNSAQTTSPASTARTAPTGDTSKDANDGDNDPNSNDDLEVFDYGHSASSSDERTIAALVKRYYAAAAADDGAAACSQIFSLIAEAIVESYGGAPGPANLRGKSCAVVLSKYFKLNHQRLVAKAPGLKVAGVRIKDKKGLVVLRFGRGAPRYIVVRLEFGTWKIYSMFEESPLP
jgi:hypothetical protein